MGDQLLQKLDAAGNCMKHWSLRPDYNDKGCKKQKKFMWLLSVVIGSHHFLIQFYRSGFVMGIWPDWLPLDPLRVCVCLSIWCPVSLAFLKESPSSSVSVVPHFFGQGHHWISVVSSKTLRRFSLQGIWGPFRSEQVLVSITQRYSNLIRHSVRWRLLSMQEAFRTHVRGGL